MSSLSRYIQLEIRNNDTIITSMMNIHVEIHEHTWFWNTFADRLMCQKLAIGITRRKIRKIHLFSQTNFS